MVREARAPINWAEIGKFKLTMPFSYMRNLERPKRWAKVAPKAA